MQHPPQDHPTHTHWGAAPEGAAPLPGAPSGLLQAGEPTGPPAPQAKDRMAHTERQAYLVYSHPLNSRGLYRDIRREATQRLSLKHRHEIEGSRGMQAALAQRSTFLLPCHWEAGQKAGCRKGRSGQIREGAEPGGARPRVLYQAWPPRPAPKRQALDPGRLNLCGAAGGAGSANPGPEGPLQSSPSPPGVEGTPWLGWGVCGLGQAIGSQAFPGYQRSPRPACLPSLALSPSPQGAGRARLRPCTPLARGPCVWNKPGPGAPSGLAPPPPPVPSSPQPDPGATFQTRAPDGPAPLISSPRTSGEATGSS